MRKIQPHVAPDVSPDAAKNSDSSFTIAYDITYSTMNRRKLAKLRGEISAMRRAPQTARDLERMALQLGRSSRVRGKHPMWLSEHFDLPPLSIPRHGGRDLPVGTRNSILNQLEEDVLAWEEYFEEVGDGEGE